MKQLYVLRTHYYNDFIEFQWNKFQTELGKENCYLMMDDTKISSSPFPPESVLRYDPHKMRTTSNRELKQEEDEHPRQNKKIIYVNYQECCQVNRLHRDNQGQVESQLYLLFQIIPQSFEYMYLIEYDVYCDGNWKTTLDKNNWKTEDFLATHVNDYSVYHIAWGHWFNLKGSKRLKPKREERVKSFFPITRYSLSFFHMLEKTIGQYTGFCEVYIPSLVKQHHLTYSNIDASCIGIHWIFTNEPKDRFRPKLGQTDTLLHPINQVLTS